MPNWGRVVWSYGKVRKAKGSSWWFMDVVEVRLPFGRTSFPSWLTSILRLLYVVTLYALEWKPDGLHAGLDVGGSDLIASGDIKIKHGTPAAFTERTLVFRDGSEVEADVVVMAWVYCTSVFKHNLTWRSRTGYEKIRNSNKALFGEETINRTCEICGYDGEGELRGGYRPTGHPGVSDRSGMPG